MAMAGNDVAPVAVSPAFKPVKRPCASYPAAKSLPAIEAFLPAPATGSLALVLREASGIAQTEARYRMSYNRTRQKRGPPSLHA